MVLVIGRQKVDIDAKNGSEAVHGYKYFVTYRDKTAKGLEGHKCDSTFIRIDVTLDDQYFPGVGETVQAERNEKGKIIEFLPASA